MHNSSTTTGSISTGAASAAGAPPPAGAHWCFSARRKRNALAPPRAGRPAGEPPGPRSRAGRARAPTEGPFVHLGAGFSGPGRVGAQIFAC
eukprot:scaffold2088_cov399-Prasinococcus_capsulatus_cf.AAC.21